MKNKPSKQEIQYAERLAEEQLENEKYPLRKYSTTQLKTELKRRKH